jgi:hypothetical protein
MERFVRHDITMLGGLITTVKYGEIAQYHYEN